MRTILKKDIKKGAVFCWNASLDEFSGVYEVICFTKDLGKILCYKPAGKKATIHEESLAKFDKSIIKDEDFMLLETTTPYRG